MTSMTDIIERNQKNYKSFVLQTCKEQVLTVNIVMYFQKNFYLKEEIDKMLSQFGTAGILEHWIQKFADQRFYNVKTLQTGAKRLQIQHLFGIFNLWLFGCGIGLIIFLGEISMSLINKRFVEQKITFIQHQECSTINRN